MHRFNSFLLSANRYWLYLALFLVSITVVVLFLQVMPSSLQNVGFGSDFLANYAPAAHNLLAGRGLTLKNGAPALHYPPGYSLILAGIFALSQYLGVNYIILIYIFNVLVSSAVAVIIYSLASEIWGPVSGIMVFLIWITYLPNLWLNGLSSTTIPFMAFFLSGIYLIISRCLRHSLSGSACFFSGVLMGAAMLIRPIAIGMSFILAMVIWLFHSNHRFYLKIFFIILVFAGNLLVVTPWEGWMYQKSGKILPLCASGVNAIRDGLTFAVKEKGYRQGVWVPAAVRALQEDIKGQYSQLNTVSDIGSVLADKLRTQPVALMELFAIKLVRSWYGTDSQRFEMPLLLVQAIYLIFIIWGTTLTWKMGLTARKLVLGIWLIVFYFWGMCIISLTILRYMVPIMGLLFLFLPPIFIRGLREVQLPNNLVLGANAPC